MPFISLRNDPPTVVFSGDHTIEDEFLHGFLKEQGQARYEEGFQRALRIGARALLDGRIGVVLSRVEAELDSELQSLQHLLRIADLNQRAAKGQVAEDVTSAVLSDLIDRRGWGDALRATGGTVGAIPRSKVGDLVVRVEDRVDIVIEVKMQKGYDLGAPSVLDVRTRNAKAAKETVYGQLLAARENRRAAFGIFVVDVAEMSASVGALEPIHLLPEVPGLLVKVDPSEGRWENLAVAYQLARQLALTPQWETQLESVRFLLGRMLRDLGHLSQLGKELGVIRDAAQRILDTAVGAEKRLELAALSLRATESQVERLAAGDAPTPADLLALLGDEVAP
jgi:hypothetical protein